MREAVNNYLETALDYAQAGLFADALQLLELYAGEAAIVSYYKGWLMAQNGNTEEAKRQFRVAASGNPDGYFPNKIEEILILRSAIVLNPSDARARYYLGNLWYDKRQYPEAVACWEKATQLDATFPTAFRNLALAYYNKLGKKEQARKFLEKAFSLDTTDARVLMELDQLYKSTGMAFAERLALLETHLPQVLSRDDLYLERVTLYNSLGQYEKARQLLAAHIFHPWEGGEGKVVGQFLRCHIALARRAIENGAFREAIDLLQVTAEYPLNLGEGKLYGAQENDVHYWLGCAYAGLGRTDDATALFRNATVGISQPEQAIYYNDPQPDNIVYQALAWLRLNEPEKAAAIFNRLIEFGRSHLNDHIGIDYFAVSLPDMLVFDQDINLRNTTHCTYLIGLGYLGLNAEAKGRDYLQQVLGMDPNHAGAANWLELAPVITQALKQELPC
jgi:tetratricopeptide (TPR) repeat protein